MNYKLKIVIVTLFLPFLLVWSAFVLTGFCFDPRDVFQSGPFWGVSVLYWFLWVCLIGFVTELDGPAK